MSLDTDAIRAKCINEAFNAITTADGLALCDEMDRLRAENEDWRSIALTLYANLETRPLPRTHNTGIWLCMSSGQADLLAAALDADA